MEPRDGDAGRSTTRRSLLRVTGGGIGLSVLGGLAAYLGDRSYADEDGDGIPDRIERSQRMHARFERTFGSDAFEGLDPTRKDLLLDARYVEGTSVSDETKELIVERFRENGIHAQWLDYPDPYERSTFEERYGSNVRTLLWGRNSFYREEIEPWLRDLAIQVIVVPGVDVGSYGGLVYSPLADALGAGVDGHVNGYNMGNRVVVANRTEPHEEARLVLHEIAHYGLCHDDDPENRGVMGTGEVVDLTEAEWATLRASLDAVRDTTGYDVAGRPCLWKEWFGGG